jgi:hypothetical protein
MNTHEAYIKSMARVPVNKDVFNYIGYIGSSTIPSVLPHDVDVFVLPSENAGKIGYGKVCVELSNYLDEVDKVMEKDHGIITSRSPRVCDQDKTHYLIQKVQNKNPLDIHTIMFFDKQSITKITPVDFIKTITKHNIPIYGDLIKAMKKIRKSEDVKKIEALKFLNEFNILQTAGKFPQELTIKETEHLTRYFKKWYDVDVSTPRTTEECKKIVGEMALAIDRKVA